MSDYWIEKDGVPVQVATLEEAWKGIDERRVAQTTVGDLWVSTVFLMVDHRFGPGAPLLYETMIFSNDPDAPLDYYCERYSTREQAEAGHARAVAKVEAGEASS